MYHFVHWWHSFNNTGSKYSASLPVSNKLRVFLGVEMWLWKSWGCKENNLSLSAWFLWQGVMYQGDTSISFPTMRIRYRRNKSCLLFVGISAQERTPDDIPSVSKWNTWTLETGWVIDPSTQNFLLVSSVSCSKHCSGSHFDIPSFSYTSFKECKWDLIQLSIQLQGQVIKKIKHSGIESAILCCAELFLVSSS